MDYVKHEIAPVFDQDSSILVLGSFPSVKSREAQFFYGHPQNRFWKVLAGIFNETVPSTIDEKKAFLLKNHVAVWDVIASCEIEGSSDSSIKNVIPNDLTPILTQSNVHRIFCNGGTSYQLYKKYIHPVTGMEALKLPSTSPANAAFSLERLIKEWHVIR